MSSLASFGLGSLLQFPNGFSAFWMPAGIGVVALLLAPYRWWPAIFLWLTVLDTVANEVMFEIFTLPDDGIKGALAAGLIRRRRASDEFSINSLQEFCELLGICSLCFAFLALFSAPSTGMWTGFWLGDLAGFTLIAPLVFLKESPKTASLRLESALSVLVLCLLTRSLFASHKIATPFIYEYLYLSLPILLWIALRLPNRIVALSSISVAYIAVLYTGRGSGPFRALPIDAPDQLFMLQAYLLVVTTGPILLSLGLKERKAASGQSWKYSAELSESELTYKQLFESSGIAIAVTQGRSLIQMNRRLLQLFELSTEDDLLSLAPAKQIDGRVSSELADELYSRSATELVSTVWRARKADGTELDLDLCIFPIPGTEQRVITAIDVTQSSRLLLELQEERESLASRIEYRKTELRQANAALTVSARSKREFVAHLSHELKTPLTALVAQSETLLENLYGPLNPQQVSAITEMRDNGERLSRLILDLLDLHLLGAKQVKVKLLPFQLATILNRVVEGTEEFQNRRSVHFQLDGQLDIQLNSDPRLLHRILELIVGRAVRQTRPEGPFGLKVETWPELNRLDLSVWDTGAALKTETLARLKEPYAIRSEAENRSETGFGLAVASGLLELIGGDLSIKCCEEGTLVTASIPLAHP